MRRRITIGAVAVLGVAVALVVGIAPAIGKTARRAQGTTPLAVECNFTLTTVPPQGSTSVVAPSSSGQQYGGLSCPQSGFRGGSISDAFTVPDSGDTVGTYVAYLNAGTLRGSFDLTPQEGTFGGGSFQSQTWTGTVTVTRGTGVYAGDSTSKSGVMECDSPDSVHLSCDDNFTLNVPASSMATRR